ncbi:metal tolerance protein B [Coffea eugenioides]|uniref:Metal tolerance protein B n=1 Tax=Coffea arabica TaxID=13443 RepID=A0A6P6UEJ9_COFAR|nr:metal tolerance protein B-like [Coffea arabica]XP_027089021.1 metal tolerance protein B-like [Coffea arabica]XP_027148299.1 metal tolerance protein B [Coffea eugenioides]
MEQKEDSASRENEQLKAQMPQVSEEPGYNNNQLEFSCSHICSFSNLEYSILDSAERSKSRVKLIGLIIFYSVVMVVEIVGGMKANSLAVLTDAAHMLTDIAGSSISLFAVWVAGWASTPRQSFGFGRLEVMGVLLSVQLIWLICGILIYEAVDRILHKNAKVNGKLMFLIALFGFLVNLLMIFWLGHDHTHHSHSHESHETCNSEEHDHEMEELDVMGVEDTIGLVSPSPLNVKILNINIQGAYLHVMTDIIQSVGVMISGLIVWVKPEWLVVDLLCTLVFSIAALGTTLPMLKKVFCILMERAPDEIDIALLENGLKSIEGLHDVHDLHVWAITSGKFVLACHIVIGPGVSQNEMLSKVGDYCERSFKIHHVTIQIDRQVH